jgi:hypothetical protein
MLKPRHAVLGLALLLAISGDSWGQTPPIQTPSTPSAQPPASDQRGTDQMPLSIKILPSPNAEEKAEKEERERTEKAETDKRLADQTQRLADESVRLANYTGWLALFTLFLFGGVCVQIGLFRSQLRLMHDEAGNTRIIATEARQSAEHLRNVERAYVSGGATIQWQMVEEIRITGNVLRPDRPRWLIVTVDNYGKTPAYVSHIAWGVCPESELPKPADLPADYERSKMLVQMNVKPGTEGLQTILRKEFSECTGKLVYGRFYYSDIFGNLHSSGFILRVTTNNTLPIEAPPEYTAWD